MFGLPKSSSDSVVTSVKVDYNKLKCLYKNPMTLSPTDIVSIAPLVSKNADKNRLLLSNENQKWEFIKASKNLKLQDQENVKIGTTPAAQHLILYFVLWGTIVYAMIVYLDKEGEF